MSFICKEIPHTYAHAAAIISGSLLRPIFTYTKGEQIPYEDILQKISEWATEWVDSGEYMNCSDVFDDTINFGKKKALEDFNMPIEPQQWVG